MKESRPLNGIAYFALILLFGIGIWDWSDVWTLEVTLGFSSYVCLTFLVINMRNSILELREQLRNMQAKEKGADLES